MAKKRGHKKSNIKKNVINSLSQYRVSIMAWQPVVQNGLVAGGYADANYNYALHFPTNGLSSSVGGTYGQMSNIPQEYTRAFAMFDEYRVNKLEIRYIPDEMDTHTSGTLPNVGDYPSIIYIYKDYDDIAGVPTEVSMLSAGTYPIQNTFKNVIKYTMYNPNRQWMNTAAITLQPGSNLTGSTDLIGPQTFASLKVYFPRQQYPAAGGTYYFGRIYAKWDVSFRGVRLN